MKGRQVMGRPFRRVGRLRGRSLSVLFLLVMASLMARPGFAKRSLRWYEAYEKAEEQLDAIPNCTEDSIDLLKSAIAKRSKPSAVAVTRSRITIEYSPYLLLAEAYGRCGDWDKAEQAFLQARRHGTLNWVSGERKRLASKLEQKIHLMVSNNLPDNLHETPQEPSAPLEHRSLRLLLGSRAVLTCAVTGPAFDHPTAEELLARLPRVLPPGVELRCGDNPRQIQHQGGAKGADSALELWQQVLLVADAVEADTADSSQVDLDLLAAVVAFRGNIDPAVKRIAERRRFELMSYRTFRFRRELNSGLEKILR